MPCVGSVFGNCTIEHDHVFYFVFFMVFTNIRSLYFHISHFMKGIKSNILHIYYFSFSFFGIKEKLTLPLNHLFILFFHLQFT